MAQEQIKGKKRKGAADAAPKAKKPKQSNDVAPAVKPAKAVTETVVAVESKPKRKSARKEAADFFEETEAPAPEPVKQAKSKTTKVVAKANGVESASKATKAKKGKKAAEEEVVEEEVTIEATTKPAKKSKKAQKEEEPVEEVVEAEVEVVAEEEPVEEDDQTAALLAGFESDGDSEDPDEDLEFDDDIQVPKLTKKQKKALAKAEDNNKLNQPGVVYVGRIPRGFFEAQMKKYFSQFGKINKLRLSRNKKTGASKHYAFVEFASTEVADIVARTMNNYLMFGHILKCKLIPDDQVHPDLFKGAGQRFKVDPRNKKAGLAMERGAERAQWEKRVEKESGRRAAKSKELMEDFGYEYNAPELKTVDKVSKNGASATEEPQALIEEAPLDEFEELSKSTRSKKGGKAAKVAEVVAEEPVVAKKPKRKSDVAAETKPKKTKKAKA